MTSRLRLKTVNSLFTKESTRTIEVELQPQGTPRFHFKVTISSLTNWFNSMFRKCCERLPLVYIILPFDRRFISILSLNRPTYRHLN